MKKSILAIALILSTGVLSASTTITAKRDTTPRKSSLTKKDVGTADTKKDVGTADLKMSIASIGTKKDVGTAD